MNQSTGHARRQISLLGNVRTEIARRYRQGRQILASEGAGGIADRIRRAGAGWLVPKNGVEQVRAADVVAADLSRPFRPGVLPVMPGEPITVNWVTTPPSRGSGGHTTLFRIVQYLETHGYSNRIYFYDVYRGDHRYYQSIVRDYYGFDGPVGRVDDVMRDAHAVVATAWPTAYAVFNSRCAGRRFYFVQDYEPHFYPVGSFSLLAENTYRMPFHAITAGAWLAQKLTQEYGATCEWFDLGADTTYYKNLRRKRTGVVFYARPEAARRGFELGLMALEVFAGRRPDVEIHLYGQQMDRVRFACHEHGHLPPGQINHIYNRSFAGLSLSLTNVSLVPHEMLAAGCIPVVNDAVQNRVVLDNPFVRYARLEPHALATALEQIVDSPDFDSLSGAAEASVRRRGWDDAGAAVDAILRRAVTRQGVPTDELRGAPPDSGVGNPKP